MNNVSGSITPFTAIPSLKYLSVMEHSILARTHFKSESQSEMVFNADWKINIVQAENSF